MNKPKTYTVEELEELVSKFLYESDDYIGAPGYFVDWLSSQENTEEDLKDYDVVDHHHDERQEQPLKEIEEFDKDLWHSTTDCSLFHRITTDKLNELIECHNLLLRERSKV